MHRGCRQVWSAPRVSEPFVECRDQFVTRLHMFTNRHGVRSDVMPPFPIGLDEQDAHVPSEIPHGAPPAHFLSRLSQRALSPHFLHEQEGLPRVTKRRRIVPETLEPTAEKGLLGRGLAVTPCECDGQDERAVDFEIVGLGNVESV